MKRETEEDETDTHRGARDNWRQTDRYAGTRDEKTDRDARDNWRQTDRYAGTREEKTDMHRGARDEKTHIEIANQLSATIRVDL